MAAPHITRRRRLAAKAKQAVQNAKTNLHAKVEKVQERTKEVVEKVTEEVAEVVETVIEEVQEVAIAEAMGQEDPAENLRAVASEWIGSLLQSNKK